MRTAACIAAVAQILLPVAPLIAQQQVLRTSQTGTLPEPVLTPENVKVNRTVPKEPVNWLGWMKWGVTDEDLFRKKAFAEPLVPIGGRTNDRENKELSEALDRFISRKKPDDAAPIETFLKIHPSSPWRLSLLANLGDFYYRTGQFSSAIAKFEDAWTLGKEVTEEDGILIADKVLGNLAKMYARIGQVEKLDTLLEETSGRTLLGSATEALAGARAGHWRMRHDPGTSFHCGPLALAALRRSRNVPDAYHELLMKPKTSERGFRMSELKDLAAQLEMSYVVAKAGPGAVLTEAMLPAVVHWKLDHYAAVLKKKDGKFLVQDQTFDMVQRWVGEETLMREASGYFLVPVGSHAKNWRIVEPVEAAKVSGKGDAGDKDEDETTCEDDKEGGSGGGGGMAAYKFHSMLISLHIFDYPLTYSPPVGPGPSFKIMYNQRDANQPAVFDYSNFGPKWTMNLISYVQDDPGNASADVKIYRIGGGRRYTGFDTGTQTFAHQMKGRDVLKRISSDPIKYERLTPGGRREIYSESNGVTVPGRKVFLTEIIDPQGNTLTFHYDSMMRLIALTDAIGQVSTLSYGILSHPYLITRITDPFGRFAQFDYNASGWLAKITDTIGLESAFEYGPGDFINSLTTPYGTTTFAFGEKGPERWLEATDPYGDKERIQFRNHDAANNNRDYPIPNTESQVPSGISSPPLTNSYLSERNTFYWDKKAMKMAPGDYSKAKIIHWCHLDGNLNTVSGIKESEKKAYEGRVWFTYPNQTNSNHTNPGMIASPKTISRVLSDGGTQLYRYTYNDFGKPTNFIDPETRNFTYVYDSNGIDLLEIRQTRGSANDLMQSSTYNGNHQPLTVTDTAGQTTTYTYTDFGNIETITNAKGEVTTYRYDSYGRLEEAEGDAPGSVTSYTYDGYNRIRTVTDSEGYTITYDYDAFDRVTKVTYPDGTYTQTVYDRLDAVATLDREGRWTRRYFNALRQLVAERDPAGRTLNYEWCRCGALQALIDGKGQVTRWKYNERGQMVEKKFANGAAYTFAYDNASRLTTRTDSLDQVTTYEYFKDNNLKSRVYSNTVNAINNVSFTYAQQYNRMTSMTDGSGTTTTGTTTYSYHPIGGTPVLGAGRLSEENGPLSSDVITFDYDELGRVAERKVNGNSVTYEFDNLGRLTEDVNILGTFHYSYVNETGRLEEIDLPNGQKTTFDYWPNVAASAGIGNGDQRLKQIRHEDGSSNLLSQFDYEYDVEGMIGRWTKTLGTSAAVEMNFEYDPVDRLTEATYTQASSVLAQYGYAYDKADNRTVERIDEEVTTGDFNSVNQLTETSGGGLVRFSGTTDEEAAVTVDGQDAHTSDVGTKFSKDIALSPGSHTITVTAEDPSSNLASQDYNIDVTAGSARSFTYDANGNMTGDGVRTYDWDAENRLIKITDGTRTTDIAYDGMHRWTRILEKDGTTTLSDRRFVWSGTELVEQRNGTSTTAAQRYFPQGVRQGSISYFYTRDHLGSIREVTNNAGTVVARYDYDPYGRRTKLSGSFESDFGFTGHYFHQPSGLNFAPYRAYSAELGRWLNRDPIAEIGGINLYAYTSNSPVNYIDPLGLTRNYATIICDGCDGFSIDLGSQEGKPDEDCTRQHEQKHIDDMLDIDPDACKGKAKGTRVTTRKMSMEQHATSECEAHKIGLKCRLEKLKNSRGKDRKHIERMIKNDKEQMLKYCVNS